MKYLKLILFKFFSFFLNIAVIKTQCLDNIIKLNISNFQYINFASYSNGDLIFETTANPSYTKRIFFGFKYNGRGFFRNSLTNKEEYCHTMHNTKATSSNIQKYESTNIIIRESNNGANNKEYLISIPKENSFVEIYDFDHNSTYHKELKSFTDKWKVDSFRHAAIALNSNNSVYYYLFGFIAKETETNNNYYYYIQKHKFNSIQKFDSDATKNIDIDCSNINAYFHYSGLSCFQTLNNYIMCFILDTNRKYIIIAYNENLEELKRNTIAQLSSRYENPFYKCIFIKEEIGVFAFYLCKQRNCNSKSYHYPFLILKEYQNSPSEIKNISIPQIVLDKFNGFNAYLLSNDIIRLNKSKICFSSFTKEGDNFSLLFIILINFFFDTNYYKIRYYTIDLKNHNNIKVYAALELHNYNNLIAFAFSYNGDSAIGKDSISVALLIFSYPNSTDKDLYLNKYLYNYISNFSININLTKEVRIENNLFGYVFSGIEINDLFNCDNLQFFSISTSNIIYPNYTLEKNELINLKLVVKNSSNFDNFTCIIKYRYKVTEPDLEEYDKRVNKSDDNFPSSYIPALEKGEYFGRLTYYNIILNESLTVICNDTNCDLCFLKNISYCIICKYNFTYFDDGTKNCSGNYSEELYISDTVFFENMIMTDYSQLSGIITDKFTSTNWRENITNDVNIQLNNDNKIISSITDIERMNSNKVIIIKGDQEIIYKEQKENREEIIKKIPEIIESITIGNNYEFIGEDYTMTIKPTDIHIPNSTFIDFTSCESILRAHYTIPDTSIITLLQFEVNNNDEQSLINNIGYQAYDEDRNPLDLSLCNDTNIQIFYLIKSDSSLDISFI